MRVVVVQNGVQRNLVPLEAKPRYGSPITPEGRGPRAADCCLLRVCLCVCRGSNQTGPVHFSVLPHSSHGVVSSTCLR